MNHRHYLRWENNMSKTLSFAIIHFGVAFSVTYVMTGSLVLGGAIALIEPLINTVAYYFHEQAWNRLGHTDKQPRHRHAFF